MDTVQQRFDYATMYFRHAFKDSHLEIFPEAEWHEVPDDGTGAHYPFGFSRPDKPTGKFRFRICVERIVATSRFFDERDFVDYLHAVAHHLDLHAINLGKRDEEELVDSTLYDHGPDSLNLMTEVAMRILDESR